MLLYRVLADWCKAQLGILFLKKKISMAIVHCGIVDECLINLALTNTILDVKRKAYYKKNFIVTHPVIQL